MGPEPLAEALPDVPLEPTASPDERSFHALERDVVAHLFELSPLAAVQLGLHGYDGRLPDLAPASVAAWVRRTHVLLSALHGVHPASLPVGRRQDRELLLLRLRSDLFDLEEARYPHTLPLLYVAPLELVPYLARPYAPAERRAQAMVQALEGVPRLLGTAVHELARPLARAFVESGIAMAEGLVPHYRETEEFVRAEAPSVRPDYQGAREAAEAAVEAFLAHLRGSLESSTPDFALGPERYQVMLDVREGITMPWSELLDRGWQDLHANQRRLEEIARGMVPTRTGPEAIHEMAQDHPTADSLLDEARVYVDELRAFVAEKAFVTIPTPDHCRVEVTPPVSRAWVTASLDPPGPFETSTYEGVYHVTPVEPAWEESQKVQWLESFNRPLLRNVTAHEVYPGHYLQLLHFRERTPTLTRKVFGSTSFIEGWAHYTEQLVLEQGYRTGDPRAEVAQLHDALLRNCRLVASVMMHAQGKGVEEATQVFIQEGYLDPFPAGREAMRGTFNPEYFGYTWGKLAILEARKAYLARSGTTLKGFHDALLGLGAPPVGRIPEFLGLPTA